MTENDLLKFKKENEKGVKSSKLKRNIKRQIKEIESKKVNEKGLTPKKDSKPKKVEVVYLKI